MKRYLVRGSRGSSRLAAARLAPLWVALVASVIHLGGAVAPEAGSGRDCQGLLPATAQLELEALIRDNPVVLLGAFLPSDVKLTLVVALTGREEERLEGRGPRPQS